MRMMRYQASVGWKLLTVAASLLFLGFVGAAAAQGPGGQGPPESPGSPTQPPEGNETQPDNESRPGGPRDGLPGGNQSRGPPFATPGRMSLADGAADGRYVDFLLDEENGTISAYQVGDQVYFDSVETAGPFDAQVRGATVHLTGAGFRVLIADNPTGLLRVMGENATFRFSLASGVDAEANESRIDIQAGNDTAFFLNGTLADNGTIESDGGVFLLRGASVSLVAREYAPSQARIDEAIASGDVAARVQLLSNGSAVLPFQDADVRATQKPNGSYEVRVDANFSSGRAFVVDFAPGLLNATELGVLYYSEEDGQLIPQGIQRADSLDDALVIEPGEGAEYWIVEDLEGAQAVVAIPHFSVHVFEVFGIPPEVAPLIVYGLVAAVLVVSVAGMGAFMGRRERR